MLLVLLLLVRLPELLYVEVLGEEDLVVLRLPVVVPLRDVLLRGVVLLYDWLLLEELLYLGTARVLRLDRYVLFRSTPTVLLDAVLLLLLLAIELLLLAVLDLPLFVLYLGEVPLEVFTFDLPLRAVDLELLAAMVFLL